VNDRPRLFLDTTVLIALALSTREHPPGRYFIQMAMHGLIEVVVSRDVVREIEGVLRDRVPELAAELMTDLAENLVLARVTTATEPNHETVLDCLKLTNYRPDAKIVAAAIETACEVLVTNDTTHLLGNPDLGPPKTKLVVMSPREALDWCRDQVSTRSRNR
jgi:predicted nucleic acid-binding protein